MTLNSNIGEPKNKKLQPRLKKYSICFFLSLFVCVFNSLSFAQRNDAALWESITLEKRIAPKTLLHFQQAARIGQNITRIRSTYYDVGLTYKINKIVYISLNYRFINRFFTENGTSIRHRIFGALILKKNVQSFSFIYRQRLQGQVNDFYSRDAGMIPKYYTRSRVTVKYRLNPTLSPFIATELYINITDLNNIYSNRHRVLGGMDWQFSKLDELTFYYLIDKHFNKKNPLTNYVIGIGYTHRFY